MRKRIIAMLLASVMCLTVLVGCGGSSSAAGENNSVTVMTIDGEEIPASELAAYIVYSINYYQEYYSAYGLELDTSYFQDEEVFDSLKDSAAEQVKALRALQAIADDLDLSLTKEQKQELEETKKSNMEYVGAYSGSFKRWVAYSLKGKEDPWETYLNSMGYTSELYDMDSEILALEDNIIDYYYEQGDVTTEFEETYYHAKSILISDTDDDGELLTGSDKKEAKQKAKDLLEEIQNGADFDEVWAEEGNNDDTSQSEDGYYFTEGDMVEDYETAVAELEENEITDELVYYEGYGWFIIERLPLEEDALEDPDAYMYNSDDDDDTTLKSIIGNTLVEEKIDEYLEDMEVEYTDEYDVITMNNVHTYLGFVSDSLISSGSGSGSASGSAE